MVCLSTLMVCLTKTHLDGVLEHGVIELAESEAKAAAHLRQADRELTNCRPGISPFEHFFSTLFFLTLFEQWYLEFLRAVSTGCKRDIVESSSGLHSLHARVLF